MNSSNRDKQKYQFTLKKLSITKQQVKALKIQIQEIKTGKFYKLWQLLNKIKNG